MKKQYSTPKSQFYSIDMSQAFLSTSDTRINIGADDDRASGYDAKENRNWDDAWESSKGSSDTEW